MSDPSSGSKKCIKEENRMAHVLPPFSTLAVVPLQQVAVNLLPCGESSQFAGALARSKRTQKTLSNADAVMLVTWAPALPRIGSGFPHPSDKKRNSDGAALRMGQPQGRVEPQSTRHVVSGGDHCIR